MITCGSHFEIVQQEGPEVHLFHHPDTTVLLKPFITHFRLALTQSTTLPVWPVPASSQDFAQPTSSSLRSMPNMYEYNTVASIPFRVVTPRLRSLDSIRMNCWTPTASGEYAMLMVLLFHWIGMQEAVSHSVHRYFTHYPLLIVVILQDAGRAARPQPVVEAILA